jgi:3-dehydroquinate synthetase
MDLKMEIILNNFIYLDRDDISIQWSMLTPGIHPKSWHILDPSEMATMLTSSDLEKHLRWPNGTLDALDFAFEKQLPRSMGWDLRALSNKAAFHMAAKIFRRGVVTSEDCPSNLSGLYKISFSKSPDPKDDLKRNEIRIIDRNVQELWNISPCADDLVIHLDEERKTIETVAIIFQHIAQAVQPVQIIGGGILADTAAFAAALSGKAFELIPTTLLAMADACVGGKTGVNYKEYGKNQLGLFAFPSQVVVHPGWLKTLPKREIKAGLAECYKHAFITGDKNFSSHIAHLDPTADAVATCLRRVIEVKARIVQDDPNEKGIRAVLNFGHTLAHALERVSQRSNAARPLLHGEAVAIGMLFATHLSFTEGYLSFERHEYIQSELKNAKFMISRQDLQASLGGLEDIWPEILQGMIQDKKNIGTSDMIEWVLIKDLGHFVQTQSTFTVGVSHERIKNSWETFVTQESF